VSISGLYHRLACIGCYLGFVGFHGSKATLASVLSGYHAGAEDTRPNDWLKFEDGNRDRILFLPDLIATQ